MNTSAQQWCLFPIAGMKLSSDDSVAEDPIFGNATIVSPDEAERIVASIPVALQGEEAGCRSLRTAASIGDTRAGSFVLIRDCAPNDPRLAERCAARAYDVMSTLSMIILARLDFRKTCALSEQATRDDFSSIVIDAASGALRTSRHHGSRGHRIEIPSPPIILTRERLIRIARCSPAQGLASMLLFEDDRTNDSIRLQIASAARHLYATAHTTVPELQIAGALTAIELLLGDPARLYDIVKRRLRRLLGAAAYEHYAAERIFTVGGEIIHRGKIGTQGIARRGIILAVTTLFAYARGARRFSNRAALLEYLDITDRAAAYARAHPAVRGALPSLPARGLTIDYLPFRLIAHGYSADRVDELREDERRLIFAAMVLAYGERTGAPPADAFETMCESLTDVPCPIESLDDFIALFEDHRDLLLAECARLVRRTEPFIWGYD